jgi:hypothetical protein
MVQQQSMRLVRISSLLTASSALILIVILSLQRRSLLHLQGPHSERERERERQRERQREGVAEPLGSFWELLGALKTEASVDYSLRMERLLSRPGWVEGLWGAFGSSQNGGLCRLQSSCATATFQVWLGRGPLGSFWELVKRRPL